MLPPREQCRGVRRYVDVEVVEVLTGVIKGGWGEVVKAASCVVFGLGVCRCGLGCYVGAKCQASEVW